MSDLVDLVERLRVRCECVDTNEPCCRCKQEFEAADEIERLRADLDKAKIQCEVWRTMKSGEILSGLLGEGGMR